MFKLPPHSTKSFIFKLIFLSKYKARSWGWYWILHCRNTLHLNHSIFYWTSEWHTVANLQRSESTALVYKDSSHPKYLFIITLLGKHFQQTAEEHMHSKHSIAFPLEGNSFILGEAWYKGTEAELGSVFAPVDLRSLFFKALACNDVFQQI